MRTGRWQRTCGPPHPRRWGQQGSPAPFVLHEPSVAALGDRLPDCPAAVVALRDDLLAYQVAIVCFIMFCVEGAFLLEGELPLESSSCITVLTPFNAQIVPGLAGAAHEAPFTCVLSVRLHPSLSSSLRGTQLKTFWASVALSLSQSWNWPFLRGHLDPLSGEWHVEAQVWAPVASTAMGDGAVTGVCEAGLRQR